MGKTNYVKTLNPLLNAGRPQKRIGGTRDETNLNESICKALAHHSLVYLRRWTNGEIL